MTHHNLYMAYCLRCDAWLYGDGDPPEVVEAADEYAPDHVKAHGSAASPCAVVRAHRAWHTA